ncbi:MAG: CDP-alcohol phosphatidyltransferase family protein, partial [Bacteroidetes bacterium]|nr:CDP-alcohol phosphatidyltransferase family protein [Bacteroidota bacterium]
LFSNSLTGYAWAFGLFVYASISDHFDGVIARRYSIETTFGKYLDPLADKVLVLGTFIVLIFILPDLVPVWAVALIAFRDVSVTALRNWVKKKKNKTLRTIRIAKAKTGVQLIFLISTLLLLTLSRSQGELGEMATEILSGDVLYWLLIVVVIVTVFTGIVYVVRVNDLLDDHID